MGQVFRFSLKDRLISFYMYMAKIKKLGNSRVGGGVFANVFEGVIGGMAAMAVVGLACITLFAIGFYLIKHYNKPGTKLFQDLQPMQILGIVLCFLACLPFIQYFFLGFLADAGGAAFSGLMDE
jgi:hypothetical protein